MSKNIRLPNGCELQEIDTDLEAGLNDDGELLCVVIDSDFDGIEYQKELGPQNTKFVEHDDGRQSIHGRDDDGFWHLIHSF